MSDAIRVAVASVVLFSSGCAALTAYVPDPPIRALPPSLRAEVVAVEERARFGSEASDRPLGRLSRSREVTLEEVLRAARERANTVLEAAARLEAASGRLQTAAGALLPGIDVQLGGSYLDGRQVGSFGDVMGVTFGTFEPSAGVYYRVNPGAAWVRSERFRKEADAAAFEVREAQRYAMLQAGVGYVDLALARASQAVAEGLAGDAERFVEITQARARAEIGTGADVARAEAAAASARQTALRARGLWETSSIRLAVLLRWNTNDLLVPSENDLRTTSLIDVAAGAALRGEAELARPDILAAQARSEAAAREVSAAWWDLLGPDIDAGFRERFIGTDLNRLGNTNFLEGLARIAVDFAEVGRTRTARGEAAAARVREQTVREQAYGEIETALSRVAVAAGSLPDARNGVDAATRSYEVELARFEAGTGIGLEVIQAQNALARARLAHVEAIARYDVAQIELAAGIGHLDPALMRAAQER
ncbi:TolC family protein [Candidatus Binatia bacterium]|nr:TolC family protein [Candidatus Binatia bacterium]